MVASLALALAISSNAWAESKKHHSKPAQEMVQAEKLRGKVTLIRGGKASSLSQEMKLKEGDVVRTEMDGRVRLSMPRAQIDLAPATIVRVEKTSDRLELKYGHIRAVAKKPSVLKIQTPTAVMGVRGTEFLVHVTRDENEFGRRISGDIEPLPSDAELKSLKDHPDLYSQVCCLDGEVEVKAIRSETVVLKPGEITRVHAGVGDLAPSGVGLTEIQSVRRALGFPEE